MLLYYAIGGGLGHLCRARAMIPWLCDRLGVFGPTLIVTASPHALDPRVVDGMHVITLPSALAHDVTAHRAWLRQALTSLRPTAVALDAFPTGLRGEWVGLEDLSFDTPLIHVARLLRWTVYAPLTVGWRGRFAHTFAVEPLTSEHEAWLRHHSDAFGFAPFPTNIALAAPDLLTRVRKAPNRPLWLIVHGGPASEVEALLHYARAQADAEGATPEFLVVTPTAPPGAQARAEIRVGYLDHHPAASLYGHADRIVTACGFNAMQETMPYAERHRFLPFPRRFDDQFLRAARRRSTVTRPRL